MPAPSMAWGAEVEQSSVWTVLVGQDHVVGPLAAAADGQGMTPSWLITGPAGSGRSIAARAFAAALQCTSPARPPTPRSPAGTGHGCGRCTACRTVLAGTHADLTVIRPEGLSIGVKEARDLVRRAGSSPGGGRHRVLLIEDADRLTDPASNVLLKAVEEPAFRTVFLLCAPSPDDVSVTIRSRCRSLHLRLPTPDDIAAALEREGVDAPMAAFAARASQGHIGRARRLAGDEQARSRRDDVLRLPSRLRSVGECMAAAADLVEAATEESDAINKERSRTETAELQATLSGGKGRATIQVRGAAGALKDLDKEQKTRTKRSQRDALDRALVDLAAWYRDVLAVQLGARVEPVHLDKGAETRRVAEALTPEQTLRRIDAVLTCRAALEDSTGLAPQLAVEALAVALRTG